MRYIAQLIDFYFFIFYNMYMKIIEFVDFLQKGIIETFYKYVKNKYIDDSYMVKQITYNHREYKMLVEFENGEKFILFLYKHY